LVCLATDESAGLCSRISFGNPLWVLWRVYAVSLRDDRQAASAGRLDEEKEV
jgi:hypothetical protein